MREATRQAVFHRRRGIRSALLAAKLVGLAGVFGGLGAICAMWRFGPVPNDVAGWRSLIGAMRPIFFSCVFAGLVTVIVSGIGLLLLQRKELTRRRWLRIKLGTLAVVIPLLHFGARGRVLRFYDAVDDGRLDDAARHWDEVGMAFFIALVILLFVAALARTKPRLGQGG